MRRKISVVSLLLLLFDEVFVVEEGKRKRAEQRADVGEELKHTERTVRKFFVVDGVYEGIVRIHGGWCDSIDE